MLITPPQLHIHCEVLPSAGLPSISTVGDAGVHGVDVTGMQGMGVNTPCAAAVAAATVGFAIDEHMPKRSIFTKGLLSIMVATAGPSAGVFLGGTTSGAGAVPKEHPSIAPLHTHNSMDRPPESCCMFGVLW